MSPPSKAATSRTVRPSSRMRIDPGAPGDLTEIPQPRLFPIQGPVYLWSKVLDGPTRDLPTALSFEMWRQSLQHAAADHWTETHHPRHYLLRERKSQRSLGRLMDHAQRSQIALGWAGALDKCSPYSPSYIFRRPGAAHRI